MTAIVAPLQHIEKPVHKSGVLSGHRDSPVDHGMKVEGVEYGRLHGVHQQFAIESVPGLREPVVYPSEVAFAYELLFSIKIHYRILKQRHLSFHAVIGLRSAKLDKCVGYV